MRKISPALVGDGEKDAIILLTPSARPSLLRTGVKLICPLPFLHAVAVRGRFSQFAALLELACVRYIAASCEVKTELSRAREVMGISPLHKKGVDGKGVTIAFLDSGIEPHLDFCIHPNRIGGFCDLLEGRRSPYDDNGHGTAVAGAAAGNGLASGGKYVGVAPRARIISVKCIGKNGSGNAIDILRAMQWVFDNAARENIRVVCMSFGAEPSLKDDPLALGAERLWSKGICVVAAAGNSGPKENSIKSPGVSRRIITVGAVDDRSLSQQHFAVPNFSSRGSVRTGIVPDFCCSGVSVCCPSSLACKGEPYLAVSGTSIATGIAAGCAALVAQGRKNASPDTIKRILCQNSQTITGDLTSEGNGFLSFLTHSFEKD